MYIIKNEKLWSMQTFTILLDECFREFGQFVQFLAKFPRYCKILSILIQIRYPKYSHVLGSHAYYLPVSYTSISLLLSELGIYFGRHFIQTYVTIAPRRIFRIKSRRLGRNQNCRIKIQLFGDDIGLAYLCRKILILNLAD